MVRKIITTNTFSTLNYKSKGPKQAAVKIRNSTLSYISEEVRVWAYCNHCFQVHLSHPGPVSCVFPIQSFLGLPVSVAVIWWLSDQVCSPSWVSVGLVGSHWRAGITDNRDILVYWSGGKCSISRKCPRSILLWLVPLPSGKRALEITLVWLRNRVILIWTVL